ncbi:MAG: oligosaccharide flippase family protein [Nocardioides sp.]|nr:oligosaccharide flippase family protein [Nocardioides sp.]
MAAAQTRFVAAGRPVGTEVDASSAAIIAHLRRRTLQCCVVLGVVIGIVWIGLLGERPSYWILLTAITLALIAQGITKSYHLAFRRVRRVSLSEVLSAGLGIGIVAALLASGVRDLQLLWAVVGASLFFAAVNWRGNPKGVLHQSVAREIDRFVALGIVGTLVSAGFMQASLIIAAVVVGGDDAGHYAAALTLATPLSLITAALGMVLFPTFSGATRDIERTRYILSAAVRRLTEVLVPLVGAVMLFSSEAIRIVWGPGYQPAGLILPMLLGAMLVSGLGMPASQALTAAGVRGMANSVKIGFAGASVGILIWILAVGDGGVFAVAIGYAGGTLVTTAGPMIVVSRRVSLGWKTPLVLGWGATSAFVFIATVSQLLDVSIVGRSAIGVVLLVAWATVVVAIRRSIKRPRTI